MQALRPYAGCETELGVVGDAQRIGLVVERDHREHGPEDFFLRNAHVVGDAREDGGRHELALSVALAGERMAAEHALGAAGLGDLDVVQDFLKLRFCSDGPDLGFHLCRIAHDGFARHINEHRNEAVVNAALHQKPRAGHAGLPSRTEDASYCAHHRLVQVRVIKHDVGGLASEFERDFLEIPGGDLVDLLAGGVAAGEGHLGHQGVADERLPDFSAEAGDDVEDACGETRQFHQGGQFQQRARRVLRRLDHHGVARCKRRRDLPYRQGERRVPRCDCRDHTQGFVLDVVEDAGLVDRHHRALDLVCQARVIVKPLRNVLDLPADLCNELAVVALLGLCKDVDVLAHQVGKLAQQGAALSCRQIAPSRCFKRVMRGAHREVDIRHPSPWNLGPRFSRVGLCRFEPGTGGRIDPFVVDEQLVSLHAMSLVCRWRGVYDNSKLTASILLGRTIKPYRVLLPAPCGDDIDRDVSGQNRPAAGAGSSPR